MRLLHIFSALTLLLGSSLAHAATLNFNGGAVDGCSQSPDGLQYTCASLALSSIDVIVIGRAYAVTVNSSLAMSYNQGLTMSGNAALTVKGNLDIKDIKPSNLKVTGGSLTAEGGTFLMGAQEQTITANISATTIKMGSNNVTVTGKISAKGLVEIASRSIIKGPISGDIVNILPAKSVVEGDITAKTMLTIGSGNGVKGNVEGGNVTLEAATAYITGNALVNHITLGWEGRVQQTITCKAYTPSNQCSCVTNNSGYPVGSANGPKCGAGTPSGLHHFQIEHPLTALTCQVPTVKVTACADASCSAVYKNGVSVTVSPGSVPTQIDASGVNPNVTVRQTTVGIATLSLVSTPATTGALVCKSGGSTSNCQISFLSSGFQVSGVPRYAEDEAILEISALQVAPNNPAACVPMFANQTKDLNLSCAYSNPDKGTLPARIFDSAKNNYVALAGSDQSSCAGLSTKVTVPFGADGVARPKMLYADAGALILTAAYNPKSGSDNGLDMSGSGTVIVGPKYFSFSAIATPQQAGVTVVPVAPAKEIRVSALNAVNAATPNFGRESAAPTVMLGRTVVEPTFAGHAEPSADGSLGFSGGVLIGTGMSWKEVGSVQFTASLMNYLGWQLPAVNGIVPPLASGTSSQVQFIPHHFITELIKNGAADSIATPCAAPLTCADDGENGRYAYSGQAIGVRVTARALGGTPTINYDDRNPTALAPVLLEGLDAATGKISFPPSTPDGKSRLTDGKKEQNTVIGVAPAKFTLGVASPMVAYRFPGKAGVPAKIAPTDVLLRASSTYPGSIVVSSSSPLIQNEARMTVLSGKWMVPHGYGSELLPVRLAVQVQYWNGTRWVTNLLDSISAIKKPDVVLANCKKTLDCAKLAVDDRKYTVVQGALPQTNLLTLLAPGVGKTGSVDVSVGSHSYLPSTVGTVVFGVFKSGPVIYLREIY